MKKNHLMKLFALLLLVSTMLVGCGKDDGAAKRPKKKAEQVGVTSGVRSDFMKIEYDAPLAPNRYEELSKDLGNYVDMANGVILFREETKDYMNNVTETYRLWSIEQGKVLLKLSNTYPDANYGEKDKHGNTKLIPNDLEVSLVSEAGLCYVKAVTTSNLRLPDEEIEENEYKKSYQTSYLTAYYDFAGKKITETALQIEPKILAASTFLGLMPLTCKCSFGDRIVLMNAQSWKVISSYGVADGSELLIYDYEDQYSGYVLPSYMNGMPYVPEVRVYNKGTGKLSLRYSYDPSATITVANALNNGDILVQSLYFVGDGGAYDLIYNDKPMKLTSVLIDIDSGATKSVELDYFFQMLVTHRQLESILEIMPGFLGGSQITDNLLNYGIGNKCDPDSETCIVFMDSSLNVQLEILEQANVSGYPTLSNDDPIVLPNGNYLIEAEEGVDADYVIVNTKGEAVAYLPVGAQVFGEWVVIGKRVYDLNMNYLADLPMDGNVTLRGMIGDRIYGVRTNASSNTYDFILFSPYFTSDDDGENESRRLRFDTIVWANTEIGGGYESPSFVEGAYVIVKREENSAVRYIFYYGDSYMYSDEPIIVEQVGDVLIGVFTLDGVSHVYRFYEYDDSKDNGYGGDK